MVPGVQVGLAYHLPHSGGLATFTLSPSHQLRSEKLEPPSAGSITLPEALLPGGPSVLPQPGDPGACAGQETWRLPG